jgi:hypothetical protein
MKKTAFALNFFNIYNINNIKINKHYERTY